MTAGPACTFVFDTPWRALDTTYHDVSEVGVRARFLLANQEAMPAVDTVFTYSGASAIYSDHLLQRCFRDLCTAAQHIYYSPSAT